VCGIVDGLPILCYLRPVHISRSHRSKPVHSSPGCWFEQRDRIGFSDPHSAENTLSALKAAPNVISAGIYSLNGQLFASYRRDAQAQLPPTISPDKARSRVFEDSDVIVTDPIVFQGKPTGIVYIRSDLQMLYIQLRRYASIAACVLAVSLWTALMLSSMFGRSITDPIVHLADVAFIVSRDKNYTVRATPPSGRDEISTLIASFTGC